MAKSFHTQPCCLPMDPRKCASERILNAALIIFLPAAIPTVNTHAVILTQAGAAILMLIANVTIVSIIEKPCCWSERIINVALILRLAAILMVSSHAAEWQRMAKAGAASLMIIANVTPVSIIGD